MYLTPKQELALQLSRRRINGRRMTQAEIGRVMRVSRQSVNQLLARADEQIEQLRRICVDEDAVKLLEILSG